MKYEELLKLCRKHIYNSDQHGGPCNTITRSPIDAVFDMKANYVAWRRPIEPFNKYTDRCVYSILREAGSRVCASFQEQPSGEVVWVHDLEGLEKAAADGLKWTGNHQMTRNERESQIEVNRLHHTYRHMSMQVNEQTPGGSPFQHRLSMYQVGCIMREVFRWMLPATPDRPIVEGLPYESMNQKLAWRIVRVNSLNPFVREMVYAFYNERRQPDFWIHMNVLRMFCHTPDDTELLAVKTARLLEDAVGFNRFEKHWKTDTVVGLCGVMWHQEAFGMSTIVADALQDASCDNDALLNHLRNPYAEISLGSWLFRVMGNVK